MSYPRSYSLLRVATRKLALLFALVSLFTTPSLFAQGVSYTGTPVALTRGGFPAAGATVTVCLGNVTVTLTASPPCAPYASIYSDPVLATPITQPGFKTDGLGNYPFYVAGGATYTIVLTGSGFTGASTVWNSPLGVTNSPLTVKSLNVSTIFADSLTPSFLLCSVTGSDASAKIQCAINLLPAGGGVVNAINLTDVGGTGSTIIDPGTKSVTLQFGPYTYQIRQLVLETDFHVSGSGLGAALGTGPQPTILQACATCAAINTVVLGTNGGNGGPIQHASIDGLRIYGATADTAIGVNLKTVNGAFTGIWYSKFSNMCVGACGPSGASANGFTGGAIVLDATGSNTINQWIIFENVQAFKTNGGGSSLSIIGTNGQMTFTGCEFDGVTRNDGTTVLNIANSAGNQGPYSLTFNSSTVQQGTTGVSIAGAFSITFTNTHFENVGGAILVNSGVAGDISGGITFIGSTCQNACGNNTGAGFFAKTTTPNGVSVKFDKNQIQNSVDATYIGFTNVTSMGDEFDSATSTTLLPTLIPRVTYKGTLLTTGAFGFSAGWGVSPSFTSVRGTDANFILAFSSGSGVPVANPTINLTFTDGTWTTIPNCAPIREDASAPAAGYWVQSNATTATVLTIAFIGTPAASTAYIVGVTCSGLPN